MNQKNETAQYFKKEYRLYLKEIIAELKADEEQLQKRRNQVRNELYALPPTEKYKAEGSLILIDSVLEITRHKLKSWLFQKRLLSNKTPRSVLDKEQAKQALIKDYFPTQLRPSGTGRLAGKCPFHQERTASFVIYPNNSYYCFSCTESGDSIKFIQKLHDKTFIEAVALLTNKI